MKIIGRNVVNTIPLLRVFVKGGVISPADLLKIMDASARAGNTFIMFGSRQDILFPTLEADKEAIRDTLETTELEYNFTDSDQLKIPVQLNNIVSSYVAVNIIDTTWWLKEDVYHYVLDSFDYQPQLKVNIIDPLQSLVPLFTGHLNFIASKKEHYWYLYIKQEDNNDIPERWPSLIHGNDISIVARQIEEAKQAMPDYPTVQLHEHITKEIQLNSREPDEELKMPTALFPYYEGLNVMMNNLYWLGLYWRNNRFDIDFLTEACRLCQETRVGKISITPWKSFIIKGIRSKDRLLWEKLMGRFGINLRHSSLELNWHLPVMDDEALELKNYLVQQLDQQDISTHGLTFTVKTTPGMLLFTSVVIEKCHDPEQSDKSLYNILYARNFNPNHSEYLPFVRKVEKSMLPGLLIKLSKVYFRALEREQGNIRQFPGEHTSFQDISCYQCSNCMTVYDKEYGDPVAGIKPDTSFESLSDDYTCPLCSAGRKCFIPVVDY
jgi:rubredoxin